MISGVNTVRKPSHFQRVPGASFSMAPKVLRCVRLPMMDSAMKMGMQRNTAENRYTRMKAAPPFCPTM